MRESVWSNHALGGTNVSQRFLSYLRCGHDSPPSNGDAVVVYATTAPSTWANIRYNVWPRGQNEMLSGRILKSGEAAEVVPIPPPKNVMRWGDLAGASVDFENGKEAPAVWIAHEYARAGNSYGV